MKNNKEQYTKRDVTNDGFYHKAKLTLLQEKNIKKSSKASIIEFTKLL